MQGAKSAVSRIEFRTNLMRADAPVIPLGYLVECCWDDARWLGMVYRPSITPNELRHVNAETWPELLDPASLLNDMFERAWASADGEGGAALAAQYGALSALHASACEDTAEFAVGLDSDADDLDAAIFQRLRAFRANLAPSCVAEIVPMPSKDRAIQMRVDHRDAA